MRALACALLLLSATAHADVDEARKHYERGTRAFNLQDWKGALTEFQRAYVEHTDPVFLFNIAQAQRQLGQYDASAKSYRLYLANQPDASNREQVSQLIEQMDGAARAQQTLRDTPPSGVRAVATPAVEVRAAPRRPWYKNVAGMTLVGVGVAAAAVGAGLIGQAATDLTDARNAQTLPDQHRFQDNGNTFNMAGGMVLGFGAAALVTGVVVLVVRR
jgi:tetratricopeptide (TPR) repeat protein